MNEKPYDSNEKTRVQLAELKTGMILGEELRDFNGRLILSNGTCLTNDHLRIIRMWGITEALIQKSGTGSSDRLITNQAVPADPQTIKAAQSIFRFTAPDHQVTQALMQLHLERAIKNTPPEPVQEEQKEEKKGTWKIKKPEPPPPINETDIRAKLEQDINLPSLPDIVVRLNAAINHPNCTATHIARIIITDTSLTARLLRLVNSAFYNFPTAIDSIPRAVTIIGCKQLSELALGTAVISTFKDIPSEVADMKSFWKHSIATGIICRLLAGYRKSPNTESFFLAGLLHDIGRLLFYLYFPVQASNTLRIAQDKEALLHAVEEAECGIDHAEMGSLLIKQWKLPPILESSCKFHHEPMLAPDPAVSSVVHVADIIAIAMQYGSSGERFVPHLDLMAWDKLGLPVSVIAPIVKQTDRILEESVETYLMK